MNCVDLHNFLHLYLDSELDHADATRVEDHLHACPNCAAAYERVRALSAAIKRDVRQYGAPRTLRDRLRRDIGERPRRSLRDLRYLARGWNPIALAASLLLTVAVSSTVTSSYLGASAEDRIVEDVVSSHVRSLMADHLTDVASSDQHTVKPWFTGKVDASPPAVDLASAGFPLIGGRLDYVDQRPCAVLVYRHDKHIINVMVWANKAGDPTSSESYARQGYNLERFSADDLSFWAVSDLNRPELNDFVARLKTEASTADTQS
jgi:anti-sigma factor (TIGR02949 family)